MKKQTNNNQCFHCGKVFAAVDAGYDVKQLKEAAVHGRMEYHWTCDNCHEENYFTKQDHPEDARMLMEQFQRFYPNMFD